MGILIRAKGALMPSFFILLIFIILLSANAVIFVPESRLASSRGHERPLVTAQTDIPCSAHFDTILFMLHSMTSR